MPLLDLFHSPYDERNIWSTIHAGWATRIADLLNERWLPDDYTAEEERRFGARPEIDIATFDESKRDTDESNASTLTIPRVYVPSLPVRTEPVHYPDAFEVHVIRNFGGRVLVAAIEIVSPRNKDRPQSRRAFSQKCAAYIAEGVCVCVIDVVTHRRKNLHATIMKDLGLVAGDELPGSPSLYAVTYRPTERGEKPEIDIWAEPCRVGAELPTMPLRLSGDLFVPVEFEESYVETCRRRRIG